MDRVWAKQAATCKGLRPCTCVMRHALGGSIDPPARGQSARSSTCPRAGHRHAWSRCGGGRQRPTWLLAIGTPASSNRLAPSRTRDSLKLETPMASARLCSCTCASV
eukprot:358413-Chlamydomonas_euryale.AAC.7